MPLWLFDEDKGLWIEKGEAVKEGNTYVGEFDHFSYWNLDIPYEQCVVTATFTDEDNNPIVNKEVLIEGTILNQLYGVFAYTNEKGEVAFYPPTNTTATIMLKSDDCVLYSKTITLTGVSSNLGTIKVPTKELEDKKYNISGTVTNCDDQPVGDGLIIYILRGTSYRTPIVNGKYEFDIYSCGATVPPITIKAYDYTSLKSALVTLTDIADKKYVADPIQACNAVDDKYISFTVDGKTYVISGSSSYYNSFWRLGTNPAYINVAYRDPEIGIGIGFGWSENNATPVVGTYTLGSFDVSLSDNDNEFYQLPYNANPKATVTMTRYNVLADNEYDVEGTFKVVGAKNGNTQKTINIEGKFKYKGISMPY